MGWILWMAAAALLQDPRTEVPPEAAPLELQVNRAIARGVAHLRTEQRPDGTWPGWEREHPGGITALVAYTLLKSGVPREDPGLRKAVEALEAVEPASTYSASAQLLFWEALRQEDSRRRARACLALLVETQRSDGWAYPWGAPDLSNVQMALLGIRAAARLGLEVPAECLERSASILWRYQDEAGGFGYHPGRQPTASMTAATLGGLAVLDEVGSGVPGVRRTLRRHAGDRESAEAWYAAHFEPGHNAWGPRAWTPGWHHYHLWALERWCGLTGRKEVGGRDWYREGALWLVEDQQAKGAWGRDLAECCFALLFLRRATVTPDEDLAALYQRMDAVKEAAEVPVVRPAAAVPYLRDWLLAGPWRDKAGNLLVARPPFDPARVRPRAGGRIEGRTWEPARMKAEGWTNLDELRPGQGGDHLLWALAAELRYEPEGQDAAAAELLLWFAFEDGWSVWLDGEQRSFSQRVQAPIEEDVQVPLRLEPGRHLLLVLLEDELGAAAFSARLTRPDGTAPPGTVAAGLPR